MLYKCNDFFVHRAYYRLNYQQLKFAQIRIYISLSNLFYRTNSKSYLNQLFSLLSNNFNSDYSKVINNLYSLQYSYAFLWNVGCFMSYISTYQYYPIINSHY